MDASTGAPIGARRCIFRSLHMVASGPIFDLLFGAALINEIRKPTILVRGTDLT